MKEKRRIKRIQSALGSIFIHPSFIVLIRILKVFALPALTAIVLLSDKYTRRFMTAANIGNRAGIYLLLTREKLFCYLQGSIQ